VHMLYLYILLPPHPRSTLFPYTTRFRSGLQMVLRQEEDIDVVGEAGDGHEAVDKAQELMPDVVLMDVRMPGQSGIKATEQIKDLDRKSTRLNSSHLGISYAVFCLKKKKN